MCRSAGAVEIELYNQNESNTMKSSPPRLRQTSMATACGITAQYCRRAICIASLPATCSLVAAGGYPEAFSLHCRQRGEVGDPPVRPAGEIAACVLRARITHSGTSAVHHCFGAMLLSHRSASQRTPGSAEVLRIVSLPRLSLLPASIVSCLPVPAYSHAHAIILRRSCAISVVCT